MEWIRTSAEMPGPGEPVLACVDVPRAQKPPDFRQIIIRAAWYPRWYEVSGEDDEISEYNEEKDEYYLPEGWYEWNQEEEIHFKVSDHVSHWMLLPKVPGL